MQGLLFIMPLNTPNSEEGVLKLQLLSLRAQSDARVQNHIKLHVNTGAQFLHIKPQLETPQDKIFSCNAGDGT